MAQEGRLDALKIDYPKKRLTYAPITHKPNILLVTVSGLRHDAISNEKRCQNLLNLQQAQRNLLIITAQAIVITQA